MADRLSFFWAFGQVNRGHLRDTGEWFLYTIVGSLVPVWGGAILYGIAPGGVPWIELASHGEFALYSAALLAPAIYIIVTEREDVPFPRRGLFVLTSIIFLLISVLIFAGITVLQRFKLIAPVEEVAVANWSLALFVGSAAIAFIVNLFNHVRREPDVRGLMAQKQKVLEHKFDELD